MIAQLDICVQEKIRLCVCAFWKPSMLATITLVTVTINIHPALQSMIPSTKMPTAGDIQAHITGISLTNTVSIIQGSFQESVNKKLPTGQKQYYRNCDTIIRY